jgi:ribosomal peptide maturation radical SAM protein 1
MIVLINMPFGPLNHPALGLSLLRAGLSDRGLASRILYLNLDYAQMIGHDAYLMIAEAHGFRYSFPGEWVFSAALFDRDNGFKYFSHLAESAAHRVSDADYGSLASASELISALRLAQARTDSFLTFAVERIMAERPDFVGFTSTFQQHVPSLALAKSLKKHAPQLSVVFGGANCETTMGLETAKQFPFVDVVVSGPADRVFPEIAAKLIDKQPIAREPGIFTRPLTGTERPGVVDDLQTLDQLPIPCFDEFLAAYRKTTASQKISPVLMFETSRGCWWGEKHHCTFCGLNGNTMKFRSKSSQRVLDEIDILSKKYPKISLAAVDNIIDMKYFSSVIPALAQRNYDTKLFYEVKANLRKDQVKALASAGIRHIQPGIESLSDRVLRIMKKGVTAVQNVQFLKWCKQFGVLPSWNLIYGFPGEEAQDYRDMQSLIPSLHHLQPPMGAGQVRLDRFSPNFAQAESFGFQNVRPAAGYQYVYDLPPDAIHNLAYYFDYEYAGSNPASADGADLRRICRSWARFFTRSELISMSTPEALIICDSRRLATAPFTAIQGFSRMLIEILDSARNVQWLAGHFMVSPEQIELYLRALIVRRFVLELDGRYLSLVVPMRGTYRPSALAPESLLAKMATADRRYQQGGRIILRDVLLPEGPLKISDRESLTEAVHVDDDFGETSSGLRLDPAGNLEIDYALFFRLFCSHPLPQLQENVS